MKEWVLITWLMLPGAQPRFVPMTDEQSCWNAAKAMDAIVRSIEGDPAKGGIAMAPTLDGPTGRPVYHAQSSGMAYTCFERERAAPAGGVPSEDPLPTGLVCTPPKRQGDKLLCVPAG